MFKKVNGNNTGKAGEYMNATPIIATSYATRESIENYGPVYNASYSDCNNLRVFFLFLVNPLSYNL